MRGEGAEPFPSRRPIASHVPQGLVVEQHRIEPRRAEHADEAPALIHHRQRGLVALAQHLGAMSSCAISLVQQYAQRRHIGIPLYQGRYSTIPLHCCAIQIPNRGSHARTMIINHHPGRNRMPGQMNLTNAVRIY